MRRRDSIDSGSPFKGSLAPRGTDRPGVEWTPRLGQNVETI
ncbi:MAG: hypothetical protein WEA36_04570 [Balneolaceae bacterium]